MDYAKAAIRFERAAKLADFQVEALVEHARMLVGQKITNKHPICLNEPRTLPLNRGLHAI